MHDIGLDGKKMASSPNSFEFVLLTNSSPTLTADSRSLIKKHVMKDIGFARRKFMWKNECEPQICRVLSTISAPHPTLSRKVTRSKSAMPGETVDTAQDYETLFHSLVRLPHNNNRMDTGRLDHFNSFPVQGSTEVDILVHHSKAKPIVLFSYFTNTLTTS
jgi:hypothetical protein